MRIVCVDLELLLIHMAHLSNEFRPHQAREQLAQLLAYQRSERSQVSARFGAALGKLRSRWLALRDAEIAPAPPAAAGLEPSQAAAAYEAFIESLCNEPPGDEPLGVSPPRPPSDLPELGVFRFSARPAHQHQKQRQSESAAATSAAAAGPQPMDVSATGDIALQLSPEDDAALQALLSQLADPDF